MAQNSDTNKRLRTAIEALWKKVGADERVVEIVDTTVTSTDPARLRVYTLRDNGGRTERHSYDFQPDGQGGYKLEDRAAIKKPHPLSPSKGASQ